MLTGLDGAGRDISVADMEAMLRDDDVIMAATHQFSQSFPEVSMS
jgi:hypothetical protein